MSSDYASKIAKLESGLEIHYHEAGEGKPVVFLHGAGPGASGLSNFQDNYGYFAENGYRALMPDVVGWGQSSKPTGVTYDYELLAGSLKDWLASLGIDKCSLVGNSMGGALALSLTLDHPELVEKLVLLAPAAIAEPDPSAEMPPGLQALFAVVSSEEKITIEAMTSIFELMYHDPSGLDEQVIAARTEVANTQPRDVYTNLQLGSHVDRLSEIGCETLIFWGASDKFCPLETSINLLDNIPRSRLVTMASCGHWVQVEKAELFNRLTVDFLQNG